MSSAAIRGTARVTGVKRGANFAHSQNSNWEKNYNIIIFDELYCDGRI